MVLADLKWSTCLLYLDDICVFSATKDKHFERLDKVFKSLINANLTLEPSKFRFLQEEMKFLGHKINENGIKPDDSKINTMMELPVSKSLKALRSYLGSFSYYRRFIDNYSCTANPSTSLTKKNIRFTWNYDAKKHSTNFKINCVIL